MKRIFSLLAVAALASPAFAQVDFSSWQVENYGTAALPPTWALTPTVAAQTVDSDAPSIAYGGPDIGGQAIDLSFTPFHVTGFTEDVCGVALGVLPGTATDTAADYLLLKWNGFSQLVADDAECTPGGAPASGLRLYRVTGVPTRDEIWQGTDYDAVCSPLGTGLTLLASANNLGLIGWSPNQTYALHIEMGSCNLRIDVNGVREFEVEGDFASMGAGKLGVFCMSQRVYGSAMTVAPLATPATIEVLGVGSMGSSKVPAMLPSGCPTNGGMFHFDIQNSSNLVTSLGLMGVGPNPATVPLAQYGATLYTLPTVYLPITAAAGGVFPLDITLMPDVSLIGADFYAQSGWLDIGAMGNVAFTNAVRVVIGN